MCMCVCECYVLNRYRLQENNPNYTINAANRIYVQDGLPFKQVVFSEEMKTVDFRQPLKQPVAISQIFQLHASNQQQSHSQPSNTQQLEEAARVINQFVSETTRGKIQQIVSASKVSGAVMVLVNAVYFKGLWEHQFKLENTAQERFFVAPNNPSMISMWKSIISTPFSKCRHDASTKPSPEMWRSRLKHHDYTLLKA
ncbi:serpin B10-like [Penaeus japonicus]|uniref:serpin B10-like n=1 Tax=Penaeus japonicus TaxID=27405 RepID=UPI001C717B16|nr:serpin B10-like [Penaeus japonicus]